LRVAPAHRAIAGVENRQIPLPTAIRRCNPHIGLPIAGLQETNGAVIGLIAPERVAGFGIECCHAKDACLRMHRQDSVHNIIHHGVYALQVARLRCLPEYGAITSVEGTLTEIYLLHTPDADRVDDAINDRKTIVYFLLKPALVAVSGIVS